MSRFEASRCAHCSGRGKCVHQCNCCFVLEQGHPDSSVHDLEDSKNFRISEFFKMTHLLFPIYYTPDRVLM